MRHSLAILISITFAVCACTSLREEQVPSEGVLVANSMCAKDGRAVAVNSQPGKTLSCAMEQTVGSHLRNCVCRDEEQSAAERDNAQEMARRTETRGTSQVVAPVAPQIGSK